jgi:ankyrin repeat protein
LHSAAANGNLALAELLLANKADPNAVNDSGETPLQLAVRNQTSGVSAVAALLLSHGAKVNATNSIAKDRLGWTALHYAVHAGNKETAALLLQNKADSNAKIESGYPGLTSDPGTTALLMATKRQDPDLVELLLNSKANPNLASDDGTLPIHVSLWLIEPSPTKKRMVAALLEHGANANARTKDGKTPLMWVADQGDAETAALLLNHQADINAVDDKGDTALHHAVIHGFKAIVELLLAKGADVNLKNNDGLTALALVQQARSPAPGAGGMRALAFSPPAIVHPGGRQPADPRELAQVLLQHGALENLPRPDWISVRRGPNYSSDIFFKGTNNWNQFKLSELIAVEYLLLAGSPYGERGNAYGDGNTRFMSQGTLPFPDFAHVCIHRPARDLKTWKGQTVNVDPLMESGVGSADVPLEWGDVVEIPETDHPLGQSWDGLTTQQVANLAKCLARQVEVMVKGKASKLAPASDIIKPNPGYNLSTIKTKVPFWIKPALLSSGLLLTSSDLAHVKVTRTDSATGQKREWVVDCSDAAPAPDLWLRDGDVIEVPEKP